MSPSEWLESVSWIPLLAAVGGAIAVLVFYRSPSGMLRSTGTTLGALASTVGCSVLVLYLIGLPALPLLLGWAMFLATAVWRVTAEFPRARPVASILVVTAPFALLILAVVGSFSGGQGN